MNNTPLNLKHGVFHFTMLPGTVLGTKMGVYMTILNVTES